MMGVLSQEEAAQASRDFQREGFKVVQCSGSFDLLHLGHAMYLKKAREYGDYLLVGVDGDEKIRARKGPLRPYVSEDERAEFLTYQRSVSAVVIKRLEDPKWSLLDLVRPNVLVATVGTYTALDVEEIRSRFGCQVVVLDRMHPTSSGDRARAIAVQHADI